VILEWTCFFCLFGLAWLCWQIARIPPPKRHYQFVLTPFLPQGTPESYIDSQMPLAEQITVALALQAAHRLGCPPGMAQPFLHPTTTGELRCLALLGVN
jgi:hypothetical protein